MGEVGCGGEDDTEKDTGEGGRVGEMADCAAKEPSMQLSQTGSSPLPLPVQGLGRYSLLVLFFIPGE